MTAAETTMEEGLTFAQRTYQTYTKTNLSTGEVYTGRTSGFGTALQNVERRDLNHHKNKEGFGPAVLDVSSTNKAAIRGREQQLIEANGGAQSMGGHLAMLSMVYPQKTQIEKLILMRLTKSLATNEK